MNMQNINSYNSDQLVSELNDKIQIQTSNPLFSPLRRKLSSLKENHE